MSKICGYSCEHNKSGVCQISVYDKRLIISDKTEIKHLSQIYYDLHEKYYKLQKENEILKENAKNNNKVVNKITYTIKPSFTTRKLKQLQKENKQLKELIDTILNWNVFKNECPMNFSYDEETNEDKAQDVFYKDDDYCENNCNDDYTKCWLKYFKRMQELEGK